ncbi:TetR/AcrR family transcriptional regulator [Lactiplantibacillus daowaiensis]|uniref:TetR/AcrR family transcriptional regulator n=1 Tax=Lactiplantibacillus daowaiensis TaxID=2559918 RepID=A0ABW1S3V1_9LACO|nr:TetR/AcrR family transcriptional regulator [Lactiplantibacillus daowaiensis]
MATVVPKDPAKVARIMQAATHEFAQHGYAGVKTDQIAAVAQVSKGLIFHYYGSKQALYFATVQTATETIMTTINPRAFDAPDDLVTLVVRSTKYKAEFGQSHPDEMAVMIEAYGKLDQLPAKARQQLTALYRQSMQVIQMQIGHVVDQMALRPELDRTLVINMIMGVYNQIFTEFQAQMHLHPEMKTMTDAQWIVDRAKAYMQILEYGFVTPVK